MATASATIILDESEVQIPATAFTLEGFRAWAHSDEFPERGKISYVQGEVSVDMSPEEIQSHNFAKADLFGWLWRFVTDHDLGRIFGDRALLVNEEADLATEPDIMLCLFDSLGAGRVELREYQAGSGRQVEVHGSPDLVVEVVSRSSVKKDTKLLRAGYHRADIPEYWLIDARGQSVRFTVLSWKSKDYREGVPDADGWQTSTVLQRRVKLTRKRDRKGNWQYKLHIA